MTATDGPPTGRWSELLGPSRLPVIAVLAGGVLLEASNVYLTTSLLPTLVASIGGADYYAWTMTSFIVASVISSMLVSRVLTTRGAAQSYLVAFALFGLGSAVAGLSTDMGVFLTGRTIQGLGGGLLAGLGYALIQRALPPALWGKGAAVVSAMWGVGNLVGPLVGGLFGEWHVWRPAFGLLAALAAVMMVFVVRVMPRTPRAPSTSTVPVGSLILMATAVAAFSIAGVVETGPWTAALLGGGLVVATWFVQHERVTRSAVLPAATFRRSSGLRWVYGSVAVLAFGIGTEAFIPLFGQELGGMSPLPAAFLGAALSFGWSLTQVVSAGATGPRAVLVLTTSGPAVLAIGLGVTAALQHDAPSTAVVALWFVTLFTAGAGIGMAFPHLSVAAFGSVTEDEEAAKASAAINTVFLISSALSSALAGVLVKAGAPSDLASARYLLGTFALVAALGVLPAHSASRSAATGRTVRTAP